MSFKTFVRLSVLMTMLVLALAIPVSVLAGGVCGGAYIVDPGDTFSKIAAKCGTTVSAITSANPGVSEPLKAGQAITVPGMTYNSTPVSATSTPIPTSTNSYIPIGNYNGTYVVQVGDTFSNIAYRYGVSVNDLWAANPNIQDINYLYVGQVLKVPAASAVIIGSSTPAPADVPLSYGTVPYGSPKGKIALSNKANGDVYVSLQGTTRDGIHVIYEYPVSGQMQVRIPSGWYSYVASVGGVKFEGQFKLSNDGSRTITFYAKKVVVE